VDEDGDAAEAEVLSLAAAGVAAAGILAGLAAGAALGGLILLPLLQPGLVLIATGAVLTSPTLFRGRPAAAARSERLLDEVETPYGTLRVAEISYPGRQPELRLYQDDEIESGELTRTGAPTFAYIAAAERWLAESTPGGAEYLFLGGGAYTLPRRIAERDPSARITVVELDPAVTQAAYRYFGLRSEHGVVSLHGDARRVAESLPEGSFDRIFVDVYDGTEHTPHHLVTREALAVLRALLRPGGRVLMNVIGVVGGEGHVRLWSTVRTAGEVFPQLRLYTHLGPEYADRQNFLVAGAEESDALPRRAGAFDAWEREGWPEPPMAAVLRDRLDLPQGVPSA
jgi:spermidine synthase